MQQSASTIRSLSRKVLILLLSAVVVFTYFLQDYRQTSKWVIESIISNDLDQRPSVRQPDTNETISKPRLVLHIGPRKTGTTTIQRGVLAPKNGLREHLLQDNYEVIDFGYITYRVILQQCLELPPDECDMSLWDELIGKYQKAYDNGYHAIHSVEMMSKVPKTPFVKSLFQNLTTTWDVQVVIVYRPLDQWFPSMYAQQRKTFEMYKSQGGVWRNWPMKRDLPNLAGSFPHWMESIWNDNDLATIGDPLASQKWWTDVYGSSRVTILDMINPEEEELEVEFVCHGLVDASNACTEARERGEKRRKKDKVVVKNKSDFLMLDHDLLLTAAYERNILPSSKRNVEKVTREKLEKRLKKAILKDSSANSTWPIQRGAIIPRHDATMLLEAKLQQLNQTISDMPKVCLSPSMQDKLTHRTWLAEQEMDIQPQRTKDQILIDINANAKLCSIDVDTVLEQDEWLAFFASPDFLRPENDDEVE